MADTEATQAAAPQVVGAKIDVGPWLAQFTVTGVIKCAAHDGPPWTRTLPHGTTALDLWHVAQNHMFEQHVDLGDAATVVPPEFFDELAASLDAPAVSNAPTRDGFRRLQEAVSQRPAGTHAAG